jgi:hypothetical protein
LIAKQGIRGSEGGADIEGMPNSTATISRRNLLALVFGVPSTKTGFFEEIVI